MIQGAMGENTTEELMSIAKKKPRLSMPVELLAIKGNLLPLMPVALLALLGVALMGLGVALLAFPELQLILWR